MSSDIMLRQEIPEWRGSALSLRGRPSRRKTRFLRGRSLLIGISTVSG